MVAGEWKLILIFHFSSPPVLPAARPNVPSFGTGGEREALFVVRENKNTTHKHSPLQGACGRNGEGLGVRSENGAEVGPPPAILLSDSTCSPRRRGVTAIALACCGIDPFTNAIGTNDLYKRKMTMTMEATADQLATAANMLMGNAAQSIPAVIIRDHGLPFTDFCGWVEGMEREEDMFG